MPRGTTLRNIRVDDERWTFLDEYAKAHGTDRSALFREWIDSLRADVMPPPARSDR
jgi:hypothetical protein